MYKELIEYIVTNLIEDKESLQVEKIENEPKANFEIRVAKEDMGRVIGKDGRIIKAIREIVLGYASKNNEKVLVTVKEIK